jgi:hypothetical protein
MKRSCFIFMLSSTLAAGAALVACGSSVSCEGTLCGGGTGAGSPGSSGSSSTTSSGAGGPGSVVLFGTDPLTLRFTSFPLSCSDPDKKAPFDQCGWYTLEISFPASLLQPGPLDMSNQSIKIFEQSAGMPRSSPDDCSGSGAVTGGGGYQIGTITFVSVDPASVVVDLDGVNPFTLDGFDISGMHTATRCQ